MKNSDRPMWELPACASGLPRPGRLSNAPSRRARCEGGKGDVGRWVSPRPLRAQVKDRIAHLDPVVGRRHDDPDVEVLVDLVKSVRLCRRRRPANAGGDFAELEVERAAPRRQRPARASLERALAPRLRARCGVERTLLGRAGRGGEKDAPPDEGRLGRRRHGVLRHPGLVVRVAADEVAREHLAVALDPAGPRRRQPALGRADVGLSLGVASAASDARAARPLRVQPALGVHHALKRRPLHLVPDPVVGAPDDARPVRLVLVDEHAQDRGLDRLVARPGRVVERAQDRVGRRAARGRGRVGRFGRGDGEQVG